MSKSDSLDVSTNEAIKGLMQSSALTIVKAMEISGLSRSTVTKILKNRAVKPVTKQQFLNSLTRFSETKTPPVRQNKPADQFEKLRLKAKHANSLGGEYDVAVLNEQAEQIADVLRLMAKTWRPDAQLDKDSDEYRLIQNAQRVSFELGILVRHLGL